jgi:hypothetical protein
MTTEIERRDTKTAAHALVGRRINGVRYMTAAEAFGWRYRPLVIDVDMGLRCSHRRRGIERGAALLVWTGDCEPDETVLGRHAV